MNYIACAEDESEESTELPLEADGTLAMSTLQAQYPGASGLKYRSPDTGSWRGLRVTDGKVYQADNDWGTYLYITVYPKNDNKRRVDMEVDELPSTTKSKKLEIFKRCTDLIVLGLPWKISESELKEYFEQFGEVAMTQIKRDSAGKSKGYGFIKFKDYDIQQKVVAQRHNIDGRWCDVRIPNSKGGDSEVSKKIFVGRVAEEVTKQDLKDYFSQFGEVTDVFVPKPHRAFAFVTFADAYVAQQLQAEGEDHLIKNCSVSISNATQKNREQPGARNQMGGNAPGFGGGGGFGYGNQMMNSGSGMGGGGGGGGGGGMDMGNMMNPAMMMQMMQMMMMSNAAGGGGSGGGGAGANAAKNGAGTQGVIGDRFGGSGAGGGGGGGQRVAGNDFGKRDGGSFGWPSDGKSYGGAGGSGGWSGSSSAWN